MYRFASLFVQEFTKEAEGVWDEIDHPNLQVAFLLKIGLITAVPLRSDTFFSTLLTLSSQSRGPRRG